MNQHAIFWLWLSPVALDFEGEEKLLANRNQNPLAVLLGEPVDPARLPIDFARSRAIAKS